MPETRIITDRGRRTRPELRRRLFVAVPLVPLGLLALWLAASSVQAEEPGVDVAAPRFAISTVDDVSLLFHPARLVTEQGDWVRWMHTSTAQFPLFHTTTSGSNCTADGRWNASLLPPSSPQFTLRFPDRPELIPFFCSPHCFSMTGMVVVTDTIFMLAADSAGSLQLSWAGGSGSYRVFKSDGPRFAPATTQALSPDGGAEGTTFTDPANPALGRASFYLAMNLF
jgi:plastocyanin